MAEERRFPPPPPPRPNIDNGTNGYNQTGSPVYNQPSTQQNYAEQNQSAELSQTTENKASKKEKQPLDPKVRKVLCIVGAAVSFVVAVVCLVLLFVL